MLGYIILDVTLFVVFSVSIVATLMVEDTNKVSIPLSVILLILVSVSWVMSGGIEGLSEVNMIAVLVIFAMINKGRVLLLFVSLAFISQLTLVLLWEYDFELIEFLYVITTTKHSIYQVMIVLLAIGITYFAYRYEQERRRQLGTGAQLQQRVKELEIGNHKLEQQEEELHNWNEVLQGKIKTRSIELKKSNQSICAFLQVNTKEVEPELNKITNRIEKIDKFDDYISLLKTSGRRLNQAYLDVKETYQQEEWN